VVASDALLYERCTDTQWGSPGEEYRVARGYFHRIEIVWRAESADDVGTA
jgi:hypothetical protein